jgi:hypothetical protein
VIYNDELIGTFAVKRDGSLAGAERAFGKPTSATLTGNQCIVRWRRLGLRINLTKLGGGSACAARNGRFSWALITGKDWHTSKGLRMGAAASAIRRLHPGSFRAPTGGGWWWLVTRGARFGGPGAYGALQAKVTSGRVTAFRVVFQSGGD